MRTRAFLLAWLVATTIGLVLIVPADNDAAVVRLSDAHGPGLRDSIGILFIVAGHTALLAAAWPGRHRLAAVAPGVKLWGVYALGAGTGLWLASVFSDFTAWWAIGVGVIALVQYATLVVALRGARRGAHNEPVAPTDL